MTARFPLNLLTIEIRYEQDVVQTRQRARQIAALFELPGHEQTAFATAVSEVARNAFRYAGGGRVEFGVDNDRPAGRPPLLVVRVRDRGPGIANLTEILEGRYRSETGMGLGIIGSKRLSDWFDIESEVGVGTTVALGKSLPRRTPTVPPERLAAVAAELGHRSPQNPLAEVQEQNKELLRAMEELRERQAEVEHLNAELAVTNKGVMALYAEVDEKNESLRRASESKTRFLSDMTHELRTPLNAMVSLSGLLLDRTDGELTPEQARQVTFIRRSAESLGEMVNDLLDLAKIEAGKTELNVSRFDVTDVTMALRGMFRPLVVAPVTLIVEDPPGPMPMQSDERKVAQVLRNFVSNALKFTEAGEVRVSVEPVDDAQVRFAVTDTGIGIAPENLDKIFEDFAQVDGPVQRRVRGTGLGLPLTRKLATLLGGVVAVHSRPGAGSTFTFTLPLLCPGCEPIGTDAAATDDAGTDDASLPIGRTNPND